MPVTVFPMRVPLVSMNGRAVMVPVAPFHPHLHDPSLMAVVAVTVVTMMTMMTMMTMSVISIHVDFNAPFPVRRHTTTVIQVRRRAGT
ncbi:MAG: hypothetical protein AB7L90_09080 [Hyphomicrobiaceae bacterium]